MPILINGVMIIAWISGLKIKLLREPNLKT